MVDEENQGECDDATPSSQTSQENSLPGTTADEGAKRERPAKRRCTEGETAVDQEDETNEEENSFNRHDIEETFHHGENNSSVPLGATDPCHPLPLEEHTDATQKNPSEPPIHHHSHNGENGEHRPLHHPYDYHQHFYGNYHYPDYQVSFPDYGNPGPRFAMQQEFMAAPDTPSSIPSSFYPMVAPYPFHHDTAPLPYYQEQGLGSGAPASATRSAVGHNLQHSHLSGHFPEQAAGYHFQETFQMAQCESPSEEGLSGRKAVPLGLPCDEDTLSEYQILVRKQMELFEAGRSDVDSNAQGRNRAIVLGQVGIRCRHCSFLAPKHRARGAVYFPAKLQGVYQAAQNMASSHLCQHCQALPDQTRQRLLQLRERKSSAGGGKKYWADSARVLGVFEDEDGLRFEQAGTKAGMSVAVSASR